MDILAKDFCRTFISRPSDNFSQSTGLACDPDLPRPKYFPQGGYGFPHTSPNPAETPSNQNPDLEFRNNLRKNTGKPGYFESGNKNLTADQIKSDNWQLKIQGTSANQINAGIIAQADAEQDGRRDAI